ncbi:KAP family P-loop NTPase fold protein [Mucilaginibacter aquariorum]|uniref:KAP family NTPase n=1 Tax=Mucilaginibacter aquariorum TaxID=2967225 RepID=A0ABT1SZL3_9SPHI|nr:P-loop NTPase fold protein [Mucilaginibacter aquariorum]MCQ6957717.1 KAP family NTPase [Mucilaginibacter aquariorum]
MAKSSNFSSDKPIVNEEDDQFQRYAFSKRIADTIISRENKDCIVIGIYGAWGEGKTSVINFVEKELLKHEQVVTLKFNPWRFSDENSLLIQFFQYLANSIDTKLNTKSEELGKLIKKYSSVLNFSAPFVGNVGDKAKAVADLLGGADVETLKKRIEDALVKADIKVVVFIDDIDRLDKDELHSILRLVKLNADFSNVTYVLSFDEKMVSIAISSRFGDGNDLAGQNFLEKIVQVPLTIPLAQPDALKSFIFKLIEDILNKSDVEISDKEISRFGSEFVTNILPMLDTPRLAVRYANTISFSIPLLKGEANIIDLLLIESIKIFYPAFYTFIKSNPDYFIGSFSSDKDNRKNDENKKAAFKEALEELAKNLSLVQKEAAKNLLQAVFPQLREAFHNVNTSGHGIQWFKEKRICSPFYFKRYFSYSVIKGEISDIEFDDFLSNVESEDFQLVSEKLKYFIDNTSNETLIKKMRFIIDDLSLEKLTRIGLSICNISNEFIENTKFHWFVFLNPQRQAVAFLKLITEQITDKGAQTSFILDLVKYAQSFDFAYDIHYWFKPMPEKDEIITPEQHDLLSRALLARALNDAGDMPLFEKFPMSVQKVLEAWKKFDSKELAIYIKNALTTDDSNVVSLIVAFTPYITSSTNPEGYLSDMKKEDFVYLTSIIDKKLVKRILKKYLKSKKIPIVTPVWSNSRTSKNLSIENLLMQTIHWCNLKELNIDKAVEI